MQRWRRRRRNQKRAHAHEGNERIADSASGLKALEAHAQTMRSQHLRTLFAQDPQRGERLTVEAAGLYLDYSKNRITDDEVLESCVPVNS
ncbi:MAG: hypothetical protein MZV65_18525 [Chromatiales bacterium]|nr:hypothetical protein [Chromatiales bacterium]